MFPGIVVPPSRDPIPRSLTAPLAARPPAGPAARRPTPKPPEPSQGRPPSACQRFAASPCRQPPRSIAGSRGRRRRGRYNLPHVSTTPDAASPAGPSRRQNPPGGAARGGAARDHDPRRRERELARVPRRRRAGDGRRRSAPAPHLEHHRERGVEDPRRRPRLVIAGRLGRPHLLDHGGQRRRDAGAADGALLPLRLAPGDARQPVPRRPAGRPDGAGAGRAPLARPRARLRQRRDRLDHGGQRRLAAVRPAPQEHLRVVHPGDRRRTGLLLLRQRRRLRPRHGRQPRLGTALRPGRDAPRLGAPPPRRPSTTTRCSSSTTTTISRSWSPSTPPRGPSDGASTATRAPTGRPRSSGSTTPAPS